MRRVPQLGLLFSFSGALLLADPAAQAQPAPAASDAPSAVEPAQQAEALLERAKVLFRAGEYRQALPLVEQAYSLTRAPRFLFNLGVLHHKLSECVPAREHFELYLQQEQAGGAARADALVALEELHVRCPAGGSPPATAALPAPVPPALQQVDTHAPERSPRGPVPAPPLPTPGGPAVGPSADRTQAPPPVQHLQDSSWAPSSSALVLMGLGTAAGVGALVSLANQQRVQEDIDGLAAQTTREGLAWDELEGPRREMVSDARLYRSLSFLLAAASGVLLGAGATMWIVEVNDSASSGALSVSYRGRF